MLVSRNDPDIIRAQKKQQHIAACGWTGSLLKRAMSDLSLKEERGLCWSGYKLTWLSVICPFLSDCHISLSRARAVCPVSLHSKSLAQCLVHDNRLPYFSWINEQIHKWLVLRFFMRHTLASQGHDLILVLGDGRQGSVANIQVHDDRGTKMLSTWGLVEGDPRANHRCRVKSWLPPVIIEDHH